MSSPNTVQEKRPTATALTLGAEIAARRERAGFTQIAFAKALKKKPGVVSAWETGKSLPGLANVVAVCALLHTTPNDLLVAAGFLAPTDAPARVLPMPSPAASLTAPEGAMDDATFRQVWKRVALIWKHREQSEARTVQWNALVQNVHAFSLGLEDTPGHADISTGKPPRTRAVRRPGASGENP